MKLRWGVSVIALAVAACSSGATSRPARLVGANSLVQVGPLVFVTATDRNELRVLRLPVATTGTTQFVAAPNPLEALAIPVVPRPELLARDHRFEDVTWGDVVVSQGQEVAGAYVYAVSFGVPAISIVGAAEDSLVEMKRLATDSPVTAVDGRALLSGASQLFFATFDGASARLVRVDVPAPDTLKVTSAASLLASAKILAAFPGEAVVSLLTLPGAKVAVATRASQGKVGSVWLIDEANLSSRPLAFGAPIKQLATHPGFVVNSTVVPAASRLFGLLDEAACGSPSCGGVLAVDVATGTVANDASGRPMFPMRFEGGLGAGLTVSPRTALALDGEVLPAERELVGLATSTEGNLNFFDAARLWFFDREAVQASVGSFAVTSASGTAKEFSMDAGAVRVASDRARDETVRMTFEGFLPGLEALPVAVSDGLVLKATAQALVRAAVGDRVVFFAGATACADEVEVASVDAGSLTLSRLPDGCSGRTAYSVRAGGAARLVVEGNASGYMGRTAVGQTFVFEGSVLRNFDGTAPTQPYLEVPLVFASGAEALAERGAVFSFVVEDAYSPYRVRLPGLQTAVTTCTFDVPSTPLFVTSLQRLLVSYPSANGVAELLLGTAGVDPTTLLKEASCFR